MCLLGVVTNFVSTCVLSYFCTGLNYLLVKDGCLFELSCHIVWWKFTDVSEVLAEFNIWAVRQQTS
jgi:hypothetical protein